jgi:hypothetical protein
MKRSLADRGTARVARVALAVIAAFVAVTAVGGGLALLTGLEAERYPLEKLTGTPFATYTIPALLLTVVVGGSAALALASCLRARSYRAGRVAAAGTILMGWILGEVAILRPATWSWIELLYFALGAVLVLGALLRPDRPAGRRSPQQRQS